MIAIACSTRCFPLEDPARALARIVWASFRAAEIACPREAALPEELLRDRLDAEDLALVAVESGSMAADSLEAAMDAAVHVGRCAVLAQRLGASRVILEAPPEGSVVHLAHALSRLAPALRDVPVGLCLRPRAGTILPMPPAVGELCTQADAIAAAGSDLPPSSRLYLSLDPAEVALAGGDPEAALADALASESAAPLGHVYLTDCRGGARVAPGTGEIDWGRLSGMLLSGGYDGAVSVLLEGIDPLFAESEAKEAAAFARALFPEAIFAPAGGG